MSRSQANARPAEEWAEQVPWKRLSPRARETKERIATLIAEGYSHDEVADRTGIESREVARAMAELKEEARALVDGAELPPLTAEEQEALRESLREYGQLVPVLVDEAGRPLDGEHRLRLLEELGAEPEVRVVETGGDTEKARQVTLTVNATRRNLSAGARRRAIEAELVRDPSRSDRSIAALLGVSNHTVATYRASLQERGQLTRLEARVGRDGVAQRVVTRRPAARPSGSGRVRRHSATAVLDPGDAIGGVGFLSDEGIRVRLSEQLWFELERPLALTVTVEVAT